MVESRSVIRNAKNARGLERDRAAFFPPPPPPFPSRARLNFAFNTFPLRILSESLAQAMIRLNHYLRVINRFSRPLNSLSRAEHFRHSSPFT